MIPGFGFVDSLQKKSGFSGMPGLFMLEARPQIARYSVRGGPSPGGTVGSSSKDRYTTSTSTPASVTARSKRAVPT